MEAVTLLIAVVALALAIVAFVRTGGVGDVRSSTDLARDRTADILDRLEQIVRGKEKPPEK
jgi:hypothetical protein